MTRSELLALVAAYTKRTDLGTYLGDFLKLAESRIARAVRAVEMVVYSSIDTAAVSPVQANAYALPADFLEIKDVNVTRGTRRLTVRAVGRDEINAASGGSGGPPSVYSIYDGLIELRPGPSESVVNLIYFGRLAALTGDDDTNELLTNHPALYIYGMLVEAYEFIQDDDQRAKAIATFEAEVNLVNDGAWNAEFGTAPTISPANNYSAQGARQ